MLAHTGLKKNPAVAGLIVGMLLVFACVVHAQSLAKVYVGDQVAVGKGYARSYVTTDSACTPSSIGVTFTADALTGLPATAPSDELPYSEYILPLPSGISVPPYTHIAVDWNPQGHIPLPLYGVPHFDFHFYMITQQERCRITAVGPDLAVVEKKPPAEYVPKGYIWTPGGVPQMGAHWIPENTPELHGGKFEHTFIYGFYNGQMVFIEPMITMAYLQTKPNYFQYVGLPVKYPKPGYYPTGYAVRFDQQACRYVIALTGLARRE
jgi:hypothetical protein